MQGVFLGITEDMIPIKLLVAIPLGRRERKGEERCCKRMMLCCEITCALFTIRVCSCDQTRKKKEKETESGRQKSWKDRRHLTPNQEQGAFVSL